MTSYRLYLIDAETGKCSGKKRDYPSEEHFIKYAEKTYKRYNDYTFYSGRANTKGKAKLCFLNGDLKWKEVSQEKLNELLNKWKK